MARQTINIGTNANDGTGDPLRTAFDKINDNFSELYADSDASTILEHDTAPKLSANLDVNNNQITTDVTNGNVSIQPNGTGNVTIAAIQVQGTSLSSSDSTVINVNDGLIVDGTATVSGALSSATSLALASGATVTGIADEDDMTSNSTVLSIDLDSEVLHFAGGTGISTSVSNNTVTHAIDTGTVVTLTDSQTLTNKVLTSPTISSPTITGVTITTSLTTNDITTNGSNANLTLDPQGTGTIELAAATNITGNVNVTGTLTTDDITTAGNHALTGNSTISGTLTVQGTVNADTFISNSNGDITIDPAGTGAIVLTGPITHAGIQTTTGQMNVDNIRIDGNAITATNSNGGINITPDGTGNITLGGNYVAVTNELAAADVAVSSELLLASGAQIVQVATNQDLVLATNGTGAVTTSAQLTLTGSFKRAIHTFTATDSVTETEHAGRTLLLGEVGGNANVVLTMPDATGSGNVYEFIVSVAMGGSTTYKIQAADADNTFSGMVQYLDEDGTAVTAFPTVAASDTITLNSGTQGGLVGDTVTLIDIAANKYAVKGQMRVSAGANPATPFSAAVS